MRRTLSSTSLPQTAPVFALLFAQKGAGVSAAQKTARLTFPASAAAANKNRFQKKEAIPVKETRPLQGAFCQGGKLPQSPFQANFQSSAQRLEGCRGPRKVAYKLFRIQRPLCTPLFAKALGSWPGASGTLHLCR
ncbi:MAG TPA: hypothetical protein IAC36_04990 [Candidatus Aphodomonas merdavium]|nr:hypothetical protein [Candidatus Aphodomonas merdavium]